IIDVPLKTISLETTQGTLAENMVALGASCALFGLKLELLHQLIAEIFNRKGEAVVVKNQTAATRGFETVLT
ncbi:MAG TPA: 2-oxoacid:acceptor oxidoreductase subunit alpha, partial [Candidatus Pacebacteria bacterium]|nr:2-oxoacid:acceptor oxidoreductase subunit alpha [Candidatus Paceibacterota bacterium]